MRIRQSDERLRSLSDVVRHLEGHQCETVYVDKPSRASDGRAARRDFDVFINLCDGPGTRTAPALRSSRRWKAGLPFTGATSTFTSPPRVMKRVCHFWGIKAPAYVFASEARVLSGGKHTPVPMITKHPNSYSSIGLTKESRVEPCALHEQARKMIDQFGGTLIEEFVEGGSFPCWSPRMPTTRWSHSLINRRVSFSQRRHI